MNIKQIEEKIAQYEAKLQRKENYVARKGGKKVIKTKPIAGHLAKYYREEIAKLTNEKKYVEQKSQIHDVPWNQVYFEQNQIKVMFNSKYSLPFPFQPSRKSFEYIKPYLNRINLPPLEVTIRGREILKIDNLEYFSQVVEMLNFKTRIEGYLREGQPQSISTIISCLDTLSNKAIKELLSLQNKGQYLSHLCDIQASEFKIIPVPELFIYANSLKEEDTFIFTVENGDNVQLIWESVNFARATFVFNVDQKSYLDKLYTVFGYIISPERHKRTSLRELIPQTEAIKVIQHDNFEEWKLKITNV
ncbi:hypothetical protein ACUN24_20395 [Pedobacter sp. WC2501]|uniref:hypothetical protein n=1 Tax=Pedobacter sp. WC2501 TaxID=3461400 RepID=UPI0040462A82